MPKRANVHVSVPLTNLAIHYHNLAFVNSILLPIVPVLKEADKYYVFGREEMREVDSHRAIGAESHEMDWDVSTGSYSCEEYSLKKLVADRIANNADAPIRPKITSTNKLLRMLGLGYEKRTKLLITGGSLSHANPSPKWDGTNPTIEKDIDDAKGVIELAAGVTPNTISFNTDVKNTVKRDSTVRNLIRYTIAGSGGQELLVNGELPPILWGMKVVVAGAAEDTAKRGQSASNSRIWSDDVLIAYIEPSPSLEALTLGYTFRVKGSTAVKVWREENRKGEFVEPSFIQDEKLVATAAGYILDDVLA